MSLRYMFQRIVESSLGRIYWTSNMWAVIGSRWDRKRLQNKNLIGSDRVNEKGEWDNGISTLVAKMNTWCPHPPMPAEEVYKHNEKELWNVPASECRKCPFHEKATRRRRYPICKFKGGSPEKAAENVRNIMSEAVAGVREVMGQ